VYSKFYYTVYALSDSSRRCFQVRTNSLGLNQCCTDEPSLTSVTSSQLTCCLECLYYGESCHHFNFENVDNIKWCQIFLYLPTHFSVVQNCTHYQDTLYNGWYTLCRPTHYQDTLYNGWYMLCVLAIIAGAHNKYQHGKIPNMAFFAAPANMASLSFLQKIHLYKKSQFRLFTWKSEFIVSRIHSLTLVNNTICLESYEY